MKKLILILITFCSVSMSKDYIDTTIDVIDSIAIEEQKLRSSNALIKSKTDLDNLSTITYENFPLNFLSSKNKAIFIDSLTFSKKGLSSYNYKVLEELKDFNKVYKIMSLFGLEKATTLTVNSQNHEKGGSTSGSIGLTIFENEWCSSPATCSIQNNSKCIADNC